MKLRVINLKNMKRIITMLLLTILANGYALAQVATYNNEPIKFNNLVINEQTYTDSVIESGLGIDWNKVEKDRVYDGEYHLGYVNSYSYFPDGNFEDYLNFKFTLTISEVEGEYFVIDSKIQTPDVSLNFLGHNFIINSTTKNQVDTWLTNGKEIVKNKSNYYRVYTDQGYLYFSFNNESNILSSIALDCNCQ